MRTTSIKNIALSMAGAILLSAGLLATDDASAMTIDPNASLPGIAPAGNPAFTFNDQPKDYSEQVKAWFTNVVYVAANGGGGGYTFYGLNAGSFNFFESETTSYKGTNGLFYLEADFDDNGNFLGGTVSMTGIIEDLGITTETVLMTADLISYNFDEDLVGFGIDMTFCEAAINCNDVPESIYFFTMADMVDIGDLSGSSYRTTMANKTTVPVPAAVWLMLSALGLTGTMARRKRA